MSRDKALGVTVVRGVLRIEIGVDCLAHASLYSSYAYQRADTKTGRPGEAMPDELFTVTDAAKFADDVRVALLEEEEDGASLLTDLLDRACEKAIGDGSEHWIAKDEVDRDG